MRTDGEMFARRRPDWPHQKPGPWHYLVTDWTEALGRDPIVACGLKLVPFDRWEVARYDTIASEFQEDARDELEGVRPCCKRCLRVQRAEWEADTMWTASL